MIQNISKAGHQASGKLEESTWKKVLGKMYDERDQDVLIQRMYEIINTKREAKENDFHANMFTSSNAMGSQYPRKLTRDQEMARRKQIRSESKLLFCEFVKTVLDFQLAEHERFLCKFTEEFKRVD